MIDIDNFTPEDVLADILREQEKINPASEELRVKLNEIIARDGLSATTVLSVLARISAGYVHQMQQLYESPEAKDLSEKQFNNLFKTFLAQFDIMDVMKARNMELN